MIRAVAAAAAPRRERRAAHRRPIGDRRRSARTEPSCRRSIDAQGDGGIRLDDGVPRGEVPALLRDADVLVNATEDRSADKVVFEAMASVGPCSSAARRSAS